ncbi:transcriptional regulator [Komagataeibacter medellinensis NBRC 3288]|uniref:Transcriptional regulator n=2 Tax=Komagataeibacter medellinensis TaxID=1177712 RepID=G2I2V5_KOMMN|nr:transcriptional regulator [Komagataeibacter medellinensis NBRC 3288]
MRAGAGRTFDRGLQSMTRASQASNKHAASKQAGNSETIQILRDTIVEMVRRDSPDLSARQLAVFLTCGLSNGDQTVRGLAEKLNVSKPAITRALDRLEDLKLVKRAQDLQDRRSVLINNTSKGKTYMSELSAIMTDKTAAIQEKEATVRPKVQRVRNLEERRRAG